MLSGTNRETKFIDSGIEPVYQMDLKGAKSDKSAEKGRNEFIKSVKLSHVQLEDKKK